MSEALAEEQKKILPREEKKIADMMGCYYILCFLFLIAAVIITRLYITTFDDLTKLFIYVFCAGGLGGIIYSTGTLYYESFDIKYFWWYIFHPISSAIYGTFSLLLVGGGLMALSGIDTSGTTFSTAKTVMFYCALSFLVGYAEEQFTNELKQLAETIFKKSNDQPIDSLKMRLAKGEITDQEFEDKKKLLDI